MQEGRHSSLQDNSLTLINFCTQVLCFTLVTLFVLLRLVVRLRLRQLPNIEDWVCFFAWLLFMAYCICALTYGFTGGAEEISTLSTHEAETSFKISYISTVFYAPLTLAVKMSLLLALARIYKPFRGVIAVHIILAMNTVYYLAILFVKAFSCRPVSTYWKVVGETNGSCLDRSAVIIADSVISVISDIAILVLPVIFTWPLRLPILAKIKVITILGLGGIAVGFSIYRLVLVVVMGQTKDQTILFMRVLLSGNAEGGIGLICSCLPTLSSFFVQLRQKKPTFEPKRYNYYFSGNTVFDGSQNYYGNVSSLRSQIETDIRRTSTASTETILLQDTHAQNYHNPIVVRKKISVNLERENNPEYSSPV